MKRKWLSDLKATGKGPSPSLNFNRKDRRIVLDKIAIALGEASLAPPLLSQGQISRIEAKIFEQVFQQAPPSGDQSGADGSGAVLKEAIPKPRVEGPVSPDVFKGGSSLRLTREFALEGQLATITLPQEEDADTDLADKAIPKPSSLVVRRRRRGIKLTAVTVGTAYLLSATVAAASQRSRAGEMLYPVKLQIEAIRLATAGSSADKARTYMAIAADRLQTLRDLGSMEAGNISVTAGEMDGAGLHALRLSQKASKRTQSDLLGDLLALASQEKAVLSVLIERPSQAAIDSLARSYTVAGRIELAALGMLIPTGTIPPWAPGSADPVDIPTPGRVASSSRDRTNRSAPSVAPLAGQQADPETTSPPSATEPPPDTDDPCAAGNGEICIILPIQLPGVLPT